MRYGCPYQGSKDFIAKAIVEALPPAEVFVDLFAGGCAVTHAAMLSGKFKRFVANDLGAMPQVFLDAINGAASDRKRWLRWVSREAFFAEAAKPEAERDMGVLAVWSFGNNCNSYLFGRHVEPWKHALWRARVDGDFGGLAEFGIVTDDASRRAVINHHEEWKQKYVAWFKARHGANAKADIGDARHSCDLESLERLQRLESLESTRLDYRVVPIPANATVYADPPYAGTSQEAYANAARFDTAAFWDWVRSRPFPVFVSEYAAPEDFVPWSAFVHHSRMCATRKMFITPEQLFVHRRFANVADADRALMGLPLFTHQIFTSNKD